MCLQGCNISMLVMGTGAFSEVPGGRPPCFSRLISGGSRRFPAPLSGGQCGAPPISGGTQLSRRKDQAESLGTEEKASVPNYPMTLHTVC